MFARRRESAPANSISIRSSVFTRLIGSSGSTLGWGGGTNPSKSWLPPPKKKNYPAPKLWLGAQI